MGYEIIEQIGSSDFCLTFTPDDNTLYARVYFGEDEDVGAELASKRLLNKSLDKVTTRVPEIQYLRKKILDHSRVKQFMSDNDIDEKKFILRIEDALEELIMKYLEWLEGAEERREEERRLKDEQEQERMEEIASEGFEFLRETENPLIWIADHLDWITAGERLNILYAFIAFCSQIVLKNPISVIAIGDGGSGKTHIIESALDLMPQEYVKQMKSSTMAAVYAMSEKDPYFFDGKIINMGDMGGKSDHEEADEFKNIMKELQSDGYVSRTKMVKGDDGEQEPREFELFGKPCICYTNVPGYEFDDQEMSRSIMLTPRMDNDNAVHWFKQVNRQKGTPTIETIEENREELDLIPKMVHALRHRMDGVSIENPYASFILNYLNKSKYLKRDVDKYDGILRIITAINGFNRPLHTFGDGHEVLFTTKDDILIFLDLLSRYQESITTNVAPGAADLLRHLREKAEDWNLYEEGLTLNDYMIKSGTTIAKRSIGTYFSELNQNGFVKVDGKDGRQNIYVLVSTGAETFEKDIKLSATDLKVLEYNYGISDLSQYECLAYISGSVLHNANGPFWNDFLPENGS